MSCGKPEADAGDRKLPSLASCFLQASPLQVKYVPFTAVDQQWGVIVKPCEQMRHQVPLRLFPLSFG